MIRLFALTALIALPTAALADKTAADACAAKLPSEAKLIYDDAAPGIKPGIDLRTYITGRVQALVKAGKVQQATARASAMAAGQCFQLIK